MSVRYRKLEEDFKFNLKVIDSRDSELSELKHKMTELKTVCESKNTQISDFQRSID